MIALGIRAPEVCDGASRSVMGPGICTVPVFVHARGLSPQVKTPVDDMVRKRTIIVGCPRPLADLSSRTQPLVPWRFVSSSTYNVTDAARQQSLYEPPPAELD
jgi:hypothetical protein